MTFHPGDRVQMDPARCSTPDQVHAVGVVVPAPSKLRGLVAVNWFFAHAQSYPFGSGGLYEPRELRKVTYDCG
jgi:hypothetical protein